MTGDYKGLVVAHVESITLLNCNFNVSEKSRLRACKNRQRNVHANVVGTVVSCNEEYKDTTELIEITYRPFERENFYECENKKTVFTSRLTSLQNGKCYITYN